MLGTLVRRVTVKTLDAVIDRGRSSERAPVRAAASALDKVRGVVGLDAIPSQAPLPTWSGRTPEQPMWESDRKKLHKHRIDQGIDEEGEDEATAAAPAPAKPAIEVYFKRGCPYSRAAMDLLREREIEFIEHDIKGDDATLSWLKIVTGKQTTPQIFIHGDAIGGFEELRDLDHSGELRQRIAEVPVQTDGPDLLIDEIEVAELLPRVVAGERVRLVDVRSAAEVAPGMIGGAVHIPLAELDARAGELEADDVWIVYCESGQRSRTAVQALRGHGFRSAVSLAGGIEAWTAAGGQVVQGGAGAQPPARRKLPVIHPEHSPFEGLAVADEAEASEPLEGDALVARVREVLDECRPLVQADGGDIELLDVQGNVVHVRLTGNCVGCPSSQATLRQGIERRLRARIPQIERLASPQLPG
ncbi:MAG: NifU family protein [Myxococcales bacterium]|nr:NifU family protein [Myxococcales bacterium]